MNDKIKILTAIVFMLAATFSFSTGAAAQSKREILIVADQKAECFGATIRKQCLQVKRLNEENFTKIIPDIRGFNFIPGYFYVLDVLVTKLRVPMDVPNVGYKLIKILAREKADGFLPGGENSRGLFGTEWKLDTIGGRKVGSSKAYIKFSERENRVSGNGGCNSFGGAILLQNGNKLRIGKIISTKMACLDAGATQVEIDLLKNLALVTDYRIDGNKLILSADNSPLLEFAAKN